MSHLTFICSASKMAGSLYQTICLSREQPSNPNLRNQISSAKSSWHKSHSWLMKYESEAAVHRCS